MKTGSGTITHCPRCKTKFAKGEEQRCRVKGCNWPWPTKEESDFVDSTLKKDK